jgi:uncharacterized protein
MFLSGLRYICRKSNYLTMTKLSEVIGRREELETLTRLYNSRKSEFLIVYGRRRIGKTWLIDRKFEGQFTFRMAAMANVSLAEQLKNFHTALLQYDEQIAGVAPPTSWFDAFQLIIKLAQQSQNEKKVIFIDELPWFDAYRSDFLSALEHFWNSWAAARRDVLLIGSGSAAAWIAEHIINNPGGLHNRITERIFLQPFTLAEMEAFMRWKGANYARYQLLELYMVMGGVPFYLDNILVNKSPAQNIDRMFFTEGAILNVEFANLFRSLFKDSESHLAVIRALVTRAAGLTRKELVQISKLSDGGTLTKVIEELKQSGFIKAYYPFGKGKRTVIFQLIDSFSLFYLTFVESSKATGLGAWQSQADSPRWRAWSGYAFERLCAMHIESLKWQLSIKGVYTEVSAWRSKDAVPGAQIDLLIDRKDGIIHLCECKFSATPYTITKEYAQQLQQKIHTFVAETGTTKTIFCTMIAASGLKQNEYSAQIVQETLEASALFHEV